MNFEEYIDKNNIKTQRFYCAFQGIKRKDYPKWQGWDYIDSLRGTKGVTEIDDDLICLLVENFFLIQYIGLMYYHDSLVSRAAESGQGS